MVFLYFTGHYNDVVVCSCPIEFIIYPYRTKRLLWHNAEHKISINNRKEDGQGTIWFGISSSRVHITDDHLALLLWGTLPNILPVEVFRVGGVEVHPLHLHPLHATRKPVPESKTCVENYSSVHLKWPRVRSSTRTPLSAEPMITLVLVLVSQKGETSKSKYHVTLFSVLSSW